MINERDKESRKDLEISWPELGLSISFEDLMAGYDELLESRYDKFLAEGKDGKSPIISLAEIPEDERPSRIAGLEEKLHEYTQRLRTEWRNNVSAFELLSPDSRFKRDILKTLLKKGEVNTYSISKALANLGAFDYGYFFDNAASVIQDYVKTGGRNAKGGTGLPLGSKS